MLLLLRRKNVRSKELNESRRQFLRWAIYSAIWLVVFPTTGRLVTSANALEHTQVKLGPPTSESQSLAEDAGPYQCCQVACPSYPCEYEFGGGGCQVACPSYPCEYQFGGGGTGGCQVACPSYPCEYNSGCTGGGYGSGCYSSGCGSSGGGCYSSCG